MCFLFNLFVINTCQLRKLAIKILIERKWKERSNLVLIVLSYFRRGMNLTTSRAFRFSHKNNFSLKNTKNCLSLMLKSTNTPTTCGKNDRRTTTSTHQTLALMVLLRPQTSKSLMTWITVILLVYRSKRTKITKRTPTRQEVYLLLLVLSAGVPVTPGS